MPRYFRSENHKSPDKRLCKRVIVEGLQKNFDKGDNIRKIERFQGAVIVKFASEEQASLAAECENKIRKPGSSIRVRLADSDTVRRLKPDYSRDYSRSFRSKFDCRPIIFTSSPRKHHGRHSHHTNVLSSLSFSPADAFSRFNREEKEGRNKEIKISIPSLAVSQSVLEKTIERCSTRKNDIVILAVTQDLVPYARELREFLELYASNKGPNILEDLLKQQPLKRARLPPDFVFRPPQVLEYVIIADSHIEPSLIDFTEAGTLYAIVATEQNKRFRSCNLRIIHSGEFQEHRNMPKFEAIKLMMKDYTEYIVNEALGRIENIENKPPALPKTPPLESSDSLHPPVAVQPEVMLPTPLVPDQLQNQPEPSATSPVKKRRKRHHSSSLRSSQSDSQSSSDCSSSSEEEELRNCSSRRRRRDKFSRRTKRPSRRKDNKEEMEETEEIPLPDDPSFIPPSKRISALLRMLADSRVLSIGELDEVLAFVSQRKVKLASGKLYRDTLPLTLFDFGSFWPLSPTSSNSPEGYLTLLFLL
ncbi:unnamed protein product [Hymenolepis diminuta]|uniref:RRM domain-containing protein n=1 Tax=Hymenolepis diminuta TaxID=6216 RepID=A0A0R3SW30_HYMDI|nr:unnamed protein product [Hymenolepis diminuta]